MIDTINPNHPATWHGFVSTLGFLASLVFLAPGVILLVKFPQHGT
ncbi:hypothetical protein [Streptacidiphilus fuscans]|nr:hypothetical protein [Streptacidiphilus fuscans]